MPTYPTLTPRVIGQAEKTLNAILARQLAGTGLTEPGWVILTLAATSGEPAGRDQFTRTVAEALKISEADAQARIAAMITAQQLQITGEGPVTVTGAALQVHDRIRAATVSITQQLWGDLPAGDLATAGRVLAVITERANAELAR
jgi:hypothetical protein